MENDTARPQFPESSVLKQARESPEPTMVEIRAEWCGSCHIMAPVFEKLALEFNGKIKFIKMDIETKEQAAREYGITELPILLFFKQGILTDHIVGTAPKTALVEKLEKLIEL
jgi:thioredoxin 1